MRGLRLIACACVVYAAALAGAAAAPDRPAGTLDAELAAVLSEAGFTGRIQQTFAARLESTLGRPLDPRLADIGRLLWFDTLHSLNADNTCGGCHSPTNGFGDSQPMAIGVQNNGLVGPHRSGPRNQRRSPLVINTALYPALRTFSRRRQAFSGATRWAAVCPASVPAAAAETAAAAVPERPGRAAASASPGPRVAR